MDETNVTEKKGMLTEESGKKSFSRIMAFIIVFLNLAAAGVIVATYAKSNPTAPLPIPDIPLGWAALASSFMGWNKLKEAIKK